MAEYFLYTRCEDVDPPRQPVPVPPDPKPSSGLPDGGQEGQVLTWGTDGPEWAAGGGSGVTLYNDTGQSTTGGMTQKAITDNLNLKASQTALDALSTTVGTKASQADLDALETTVDGKVDKVDGKGLSSNDYTDADKAIVDGVTSALASKADASALNNYYTKTEADNLLDDKQDVLTAGDNITITTDAQTGETVISATGGGSGNATFVAEYGVTTSQELLAYLDSTKEPFAPILVKRGNSYYTAVISSPGTDRVNLSTFGTISGEGYLFNYTVTGANWSSSNIGFQTKLVSGTSIKTINGESILGSGNIDIQGGVTVDDALSETSLNPVQNRVIYGALESMRSAMTGYLERLAALETKLADFEETRLQMTDGTNTVDKTVLTKPYVSPIRTMFDLATGLYDAQGNFLREVSVSTERDTEYGAVISHLQDTTGAAGVVLPGGYRAIMPLDAFMYDNALDWLVIPDSVEYIGGLGSDYDIGTIYYRGTAEGAPWGQYSATVNATGTPLYWERVTNMFDLEDGAYDANGNRLGGLSYGYEEDLDTTDYWVDYTYGGEGNTIYDVRVDRILTAYPSARGIVMRNVQNIGGDRAFKNATSGALDWIVFPENAGYPTMDENLTLFDGGVSDAVGIIYVKDTTGAPWGQTSATINTTGTPPAWA